MIKDKGNTEKGTTVKRYGKKAAKPLPQHTPPWPEWFIFSKDWLKILEANKKSDRDSQRSVLEMFWFTKKRVMALMNMSAFMKVHVEAIMRNLALTCSQAWVFFPKSWMYSEDLNDFPQDVWLDSWNLSHVIWICMNLLVSLFSPNSLNLQALSQIICGE